MQKLIPCQHGQAIRVLTANVLADSLCTPELFPHTKPAYLEWEHRSGLMLDQIEEFRPDVFALQEVDRYTEWKDYFARYGNYDSVWFPRPGAKNKDGIAVFWNRTVLDVTRAPEVLNYSNSKQIAVIVGFGYNGVPLFTLAATHLKAKPAYAAVRHRQASELFAHLVEKDLLIRRNLVVVGDFNDDPASQCVGVFDNLSDHGLRSAYECRPPDCTIYKMGDVAVKRVVDYIMCSRWIGTSALLSTPSAEELPSKGLPARLYGSDHLMLGAELRFAN